MYSETFPSRLKGMRLSHGFTQQEVENELGISQRNISYYENGDREPDLEKLAQFADFYGVSTDFLINNGLHEFHGFNPVSKWDGVKVRADKFPEKMKEARTKTRLSQKKIADAIGIPQSTLAKYELGTLQPSLETLAKITIYYHVRADWLLGLADEPEFKRSDMFAAADERPAYDYEKELKKDMRARRAG